MRWPTVTAVTVDTGQNSGFPVRLMDTSTDGIDLGFGALYLVAYPAAPTRVAPASVTIELALRGALRLLDRDLHPDEVVIHRGPDLIATPAHFGATMLAFGVRPDAPVAGKLLARSEEVVVVRVPALPRHRLDLTAELGAKDSQRSMAIGGVIMNLAAECLRRLKTSSESPIRDALEVLDREFHVPVSLRDLARRVGLRPSTLASRFHREVGMTVGAYTRCKRVELARRLLAESDMPVAEVARAAGFYDQSHLDRCFRKVTGVTPGEARRAAREQR